ncbi:MAG: hypothetical protein HQ510_05500 [Candidatus Marinimicrobia bacterium]|nr:hypothetical protein [Candidatus Neomarinimicrobiota bacterium]
MCRGEDFPPAAGQGRLAVGYAEALHALLHWFLITVGGVVINGLAIFCAQKMPGGLK